ncbi:thiol reductant ABC exporter subunit CydD [Pseudalkalibacillus sp. NRS-1564]|uniref:thiol reductant ABC exporter subunit CydD n=1 Tax=Pseudalkalibacillus sp. NRS-1564 TaxID=3233900 RepID=UPI003D2D3FC7
MKNELKAYASGFKITHLFMILGALMIGASIIVQAFLTVEIVNRVFIEKLAYSDISSYLIGLLIVMALRPCVSYLMGKAGVNMAAIVKQRIREALLNKFSRDALLTSYQGQSGQKVSVLLDAVDEIDSYYSQYIPQVFKTAVIPFFILIAVSTQHIETGLIMIVTAPFIPLFYIIIGIRTQKKSEEKLEQMTVFSGRFLDTIQGLTTLNLFRQSKKYRSIMEESSLNYRDATLEVLKVAFVSSLMLELISMLSIGIIALEIGLRLIVFNSMSFATAFFLLMLAPEFYLSLKELGSAFHTGRGSMSAMKKVSEELHRESDEMKWGDRLLETKERPPLLAFKNVSYRYQESGFGLSSIDLTIKPYSNTAVIGRSGSGKSTLLNLLGGLLPPQEGAITADEIPLTSLEEESWFSKIGFISQNPYLFTGTIAENIAIGSKSRDKIQIEAAAEKAGISSFIASLENGYETVIGESGRGISGGGKQRIALARAFIKQPEIILFDEPTTGLDLYTEKVLHTSIKELSKNATMITVAHRIHTIRNADHIILLDKGNLIAEGTDESLYASSELYRDMVDTQKAEVTL